MKIGDKVRYNNQKWEGQIVGFSCNGILCVFEGDGAIEEIDKEYLKQW